MPRPPSRSDSRAETVADIVRRGLADHQAGRLDDARRAYEQALAREPRNAAANHLLGVLHLSRQEADEAATLIARAVAVEPRNAQYLSNLGIALNAAGRAREALEALDRAVAANPAAAEAHSNRGMVLRALGRFEDAAAAYAEAIRLRPGEPGFHFNRGNALDDAGETLAAIASYERAMALQPARIQAHAGLSRGLTRLGRHDEAIAAARRAVALAPGQAAGHLALGQALRAAGELSEAVTALDEALRIDPADAEVLFELATTRRAQPADSTFGAMRKVFSETTAPTEHRIRAGFALGRALADIGEHAESLETFIAANRLMRATVDYEGDRATTALRSAPAPFAAFDRTDYSGGWRGFAPIFVVGLPRSGKTTVERLLCRSPGMFCAGELSAFPRLANRLIGRTDDLAGIDLARFTQLGQAYSEHANALAPGRRIVDTMPANLPLLGLIRLALPDARIVLCHRDPIDHCIALFEKLFRPGGADYSYDLRELAAYWLASDGVARRWKGLLGDSLLALDAESLRKGEHGVVARLVRHCGIEHGLDASTLAAGIESEPRIGDESAAVELAANGAHRAVYEQLLAPLLAADPAKPGVSLPAGDTR